MSQEYKPLTEEDENELLEEVKSSIGQDLEYLKSCDDYFTKEAFDKMESMNRSASLLYYDDDVKKLCSRLVDFTLERGLAKMIVKVLRSFIGMTESMKLIYEFREETCILISNLTAMIEKQVAERVKVELVKYGAVRTLLRELDSYDSSTDDARLRFQIINCIFNIHNLISTPNVIPLYRAANAVNILMKFVEADDVITKNLSLRALAWIVNEKESEKITRFGGCIVTLVEMLQKAVSSEDNDYLFSITVNTQEKRFYVSTQTLAESFSNLASNDVFKKAIVQYAAVPVLAAILRPEYTAEQKIQACTALWKLAFLEDNLDVILTHLTYTDTAALHELRILQQSDDIKLRDVSQGLLHHLGLFEIHNEHSIEGHTKEMGRQKRSQVAAPRIQQKSRGPPPGVPPKPAPRIQQKPRGPPPEVPPKPAPRIQQQPRGPPPSYESTMEAPHIMISYKWDKQTQVMKVCKRLKEKGYNVWMDVEKLEGNILIAMANAVEKADAILVCVSHSYKASVHCQTEAHYAYKLQKPIIPLMVEEDYDPDGWLGALTAMKKYIRAYSDDVLEQDMPHLIRELGNRGRVV